ncbi:spore germination protein [Paenibacillus glycinis]|uniref:Spore germination protein n=1 Tax=Paenibacillus glycinis TaxID=2697035 RepID=A0ABW9XKK7_9BACL|nr:spore germination protein [Paenibacillus glycinis]NBD23088.1 spore germination protein [Paenibacillus glycinis]
MPVPSPPIDFVRLIREALGHSPDFNHRLLPAVDHREIHCFFIETLVDKVRFDEFILQPFFHANPILDNEDQWTSILSTGTNGNFIETLHDVQSCIKYLLEGYIVIFPVHIGFPSALDYSKIPSRTVTEPTIEVTIRGPKEGFTEDIKTNLALIRKRIKSDHFTYERLTLGQETKTDVYLVYMNHLASPAVIAEAKRRLTSIQTDSVLESSYIEEWIQDRSWSPFPQMYATERPDVVSAHVLENAFAIMTAGTPSVLIGPITFFQLFNSPEDYYERTDIANLIRWLRILSFLLAIFVPSLYIAAVTYNQEILPVSLLISLSSQREGVPFPAFIEAIIMLVTFEILREAGLRMPRIAGQAISIVGALVLGQSAVEAGLVSASMVIVVSITAIANFVAPTYGFGIAQRIIQFGFLVLAGVFGLFGITCGILLVITHLVSIRSFGVKYFSPLAPLRLAGLKDAIFRAPRPQMKRRRLFSKRH